MATLQIADKPTLDAVKQDTADILEAVSSGGSGGSVYAIDDVSSWNISREILYSGGNIENIPSFFSSRSHSSVMYDNKFCFIDTSTYDVKYIDENFVAHTLAAKPVVASNDYYYLAVFNNKLYALGFGGSNPTNIYEYSKSTGVFVNSSAVFPKTPSNNAFAFALKGELHVFGGDLTTTIHQAWNGNTWRNVTIPFTSRGIDVNGAAAFATDDYIYLLGTYSGNGSFGTKTIWRFDGTSWEDTGTYSALPTATTMQPYSICVENKLYVTYGNKIYIYDGNKFTIFNTEKSNRYFPFFANGTIFQYDYKTTPVAISSIQKLTSKLAKSFLVAKGQKIIGNNLSILSDNLERIDSTTISCTSTGMATLSFDIETGDVSEDSDRYITIV